MYYDERIRCDVDKAWAVEQEKRTLLIAAGETVPTEQSALLSVRNSVSSELLKKESDEIRAQVELAVQEDLEMQKEALRKLTEVPKTPADYQA